MPIAILPGVMTERSDPSPGPSPGPSSVMGNFFTVAEVARQLRVSNMTVYRLINSGQLGAIRVGRSYRLREEDVRRYLQQRYMDTG